MTPQSMKEVYYIGGKKLQTYKQTKAEVNTEDTRQISELKEKQWKRIYFTDSTVS